MALIFRNAWWSLLVRGIVAILFGIAALVWPQVTVTALTIMFGIFALVEGIAEIVGSVMSRKLHSRWWLLTLAGALGVVVGLIALFSPGITEVALLLLIGIWALIAGIFDIVDAIRLRRELEFEWLLVIRGIASILFGLAVFFRTDAGAIALVWLIGLYAIVIGGLLIALSIRFHRLSDDMLEAIRRYA